MDLLYQIDDPVYSSSADGLNRFFTKCMWENGVIFNRCTSMSAAEILFSFAGFFMPQRYVLTLMGFIGLVMAYSMRLSLSVAITQMVPPPIMLANLSSTNDQPICPYNDDNYNEEHYDVQAILDSLYSPVRIHFFSIHTILCAVCCGCVTRSMNYWISICSHFGCATALSMMATTNSPCVGCTG